MLLQCLGSTLPRAKASALASTLEGAKVVMWSVPRLFCGKWLSMTVNPLTKFVFWIIASICFDYIHVKQCWYLAACMCY